MWDQEVFKASHYPLEALMQELKNSDFGAFVLAPEDLITMRGKRWSVPRDNVLFELGMFIARLGRESTFLVVPKKRPNLHLPSDLDGLTVLNYDSERSDGKIIAALAAPGNAIRRAAKNESRQAAKEITGIIQTGFFNDFSLIFNELFPSAKVITLYFIHSRRWRENHSEQILSHLAKDDSEMNIYLPDLKKKGFLKLLQSHFEDGPAVPQLIQDAYKYFANLSRRFPNKIHIRAFAVYPTYSFYVFDNKSVIAFYPTTPIKKSVPAFLISNSGSFGGFLLQDLCLLETTSRILSKQEIAKLAK